MPKKEPRKPNVPMRKFNWSKLPDIKVKGTVWEKEAVDDQESKVLDTAELEALFGTKVAAKKEEGGDGGGAEESKKPAKVELVAIIDPKRAQAISTVMGNLKSMKLDMNTTIEALLNADIKKLENPRMPVESVLQLINNTMPQAEEIDQIEAYAAENDPEQLRDVEKWLLKVKTELPFYSQRAQSLVGRAAFDNNQSEEMAVVKRVHETAKQIRESETLVRLLSMCLAIGNYLNGTSRQGGAYGFKLSGLSEMQGCKSQDGKMTLLHYLAKATATKGSDGGPLVNQLKRELSSFDDPVRFEWASVIASVASMAKSVKLMAELVEKDKVDAFKTNMSGFLKDAKEKMGALDGLTNETTKMCVDLGTWFAELKVDKEPEKFFAMVNAFVKALELADKFNRESKEREEKKRQRALQAAKEAEERKNMKDKPGGAAGGMASKVGAARAGGLAAKARGHLVDNVVEGMAQGRVRRHG